MARSNCESFRLNRYSIIRKVPTLISIIGALILINGGARKLLAQGALTSNEYGKKVFEDNHCIIWWAPSTYKIPLESNVPEESAPIIIKAARNESEAFQLVIHPKKRMSNLQVKITKLRGLDGSVISSDNIWTYKEVYLHVVKPTDEYAKTGYYPDPLPKLKGSMNLPPIENQPIWIRINVPENVPAEMFRGKIQLSDGLWHNTIPFKLEVWNFTLPKILPLQSAFGVNPDNIKVYQNVRNKEQLRKVVGKYYKALVEEDLNPTSPFSLYPIRVHIDGKYWQGGRYVTKNVFKGKYSLELEDQSASQNIEAQSLDTIHVQPNESYHLSWYARTLKEGQKYTVLVKGYGSNGKYLPFKNEEKVYTGSRKWKADTLRIGKLSPMVDHITVSLFATYRDYQGTHMGTTWFDNLDLYSEEHDKNLLKSPGFELDPGRMAVKLDFSEFDQAGQLYLDKMGLQTFNLPLQGTGGGTFFSWHKGHFGGFKQGTEGYNKLFGSYLHQIQNHLEKRGWIKKAYVYWVDEPSEKQDSFVVKGMENIHRFAPKLNRLLTQNHRSEPVRKSTEISVTILNNLKPKLIEELVSKGQIYWSYLCTVPKAPYINEFIDHSAINLRIWPWISWDYHLSGILMWSTDYWNSSAASPHGYLQNPWEDPMSYNDGYGTSYGEINDWGNGDGRYLYPPQPNAATGSAKTNLDGPIISIRLEYLREGIEDYTYFWLLKKKIENAKPGQEKLIQRAKGLLDIPEDIIKDGKHYTKNPELLSSYREKLANLLCEFNNVD